MNTQNSDKKRMSDNSIENCGRDSVRESPKPKPSSTISSTTASRPSKPKLPLLRSVPAPVRAPYRDPNSLRKHEAKTPKLQTVPASLDESSNPQKVTSSSKQTKTLRPPFRSVPLPSNYSKMSPTTSNALKKDKICTRSISKAVPVPSTSRHCQSQKEENSKRPVLPLLRSVPAPPRTEARKTLQVDNCLKDNPNSKSASGKKSGSTPQKKKENDDESHQRYRSSTNMNDLKSPLQLNKTRSSFEFTPKRPGTQKKRKNVTDTMVAAVLAEAMAARRKKKPDGAKNNVQLCQNKMLPLPKNDPIVTSTRKTVKVRSSKTAKVKSTTRSLARNGRPVNEATRRKPASNPRSHINSPALRNSGEQVSKTPLRTGARPKKRVSLSPDGTSTINEKSDLAAKNKRTTRTSTPRSVRGKLLPTKPTLSATEARKSAAGKSLPRALVANMKSKTSSSSEVSDSSGSNGSGSSDEYETASSSSSSDENNQSRLDGVPQKSVAGKRSPTKATPGTTEARKSVAGKSVPCKSAAGKSVARKSVAGKSVAGKSVAGKSLPRALVANMKSKTSSSSEVSDSSGSNGSGSSDEYETASSSSSSGDDADNHKSNAASMPFVRHTKNEEVKTGVGKNSMSQTEADCRNASLDAKRSKVPDNILPKNTYRRGTDCTRKNSAFVVDEGSTKMKQYANQRRSSRTKCSKQLSDKNRTAYVDSVRKEFFLEMEYHLYLQRRLDDESNGNIRETLLNAMRSFENIMPLRIEGLQLLGAELEHKNYRSWRSVFQAKRIALQRRLDQTWLESFKCVVDSLGEEFSDPPGRELTFTLTCDQFMFLKRNWMLLKEVLDLVDRSTSELFSIQDEGAGCQLQ